MNNITKNSLIEDLRDAMIEDVQYEKDNGSTADMEEVAIEAGYNAIENMVIYTSTCKEIIDALEFDVFSDDNCYGIVPTSYENAAAIALNELMNNEICIGELINEVV